MGQVDAVVVQDKYIQRIYSFFDMAFISSSEVENIYTSCENTKYALYYIHVFLYFTTVYDVSEMARIRCAHVGSWWKCGRRHSIPIF